MSMVGVTDAVVEVDAVVVLEKGERILMVNDIKIYKFKVCNYDLLV